MGDKPKLAAILEPLYASVLEPDQMAQFSATLGAATGSHIGAVMVHDAGHGRGRLDLLFGTDPAQAAIYEAEYAGDNLWMQRAHGRMVAGGIMDSDAVATRTELKRTRYYNEYLRLGDVEQSVALCAKADAEGVVVATLCRSSGLRPYSERDLALMRQVAPHWANAYAIQRRLSWLEQRVETLESAVEAAPLAMMMLDVTQRVSRMNAQAEDLLRRGDLLHLHQGRPEAVRDAPALRHALHEAVTGRQGDGAQRRHAGKVVLKDSAGRNALVASVHPLADSNRPGACAAVLFLQAVGSTSDFSTALRQLFHLTSAEAALACALYRSGDLSLAASECGIAMTTAQTRIKTICSKTGERGQANLVRLVAAVAACSV